MLKTAKRAPLDSSASLAGAILALLSAFDVPSKVGMSAEDLGIVLGALITIGATIRAALVSGAKKAAEDQEEGEA